MTALSMALGDMNHLAAIDFITGRITWLTAGSDWEITSAVVGVVPAAAGRPPAAIVARTAGPERRVVVSVPVVLPGGGGSVDPTTNAVDLAGCSGVSGYYAASALSSAGGWVVCTDAGDGSLSRLPTTSILSTAAAVGSDGWRQVLVANADTLSLCCPLSCWSTNENESGAPVTEFCNGQVVVDNAGLRQRLEARFGPLGTAAGEISAH